MAATASLGDIRLEQTYKSYVFWCRLVWDHRTPPKYEDWLKIRDGKAQGERRNFVIGWEGAK
jgi:hypothetical protein